MNFKHKLLKPGLLLLVLFSFLIGQDAWAAVTFTSAGSGSWTTAGNWTNGGGLTGTTAYPGGGGRTDDIVVIGAHTISVDGNKQTYTIGSINIGNAASILQPVNGDTVKLIINGNITNSVANSALLGVNVNGRLNIQIGDGTTVGISSIINVGANDATGTVGFNPHHFTVNKASVTYTTTADESLNITGDFTVTGNSNFSPTAPTLGTINFVGGSASGQTVSIGSLDNVDIVNLTLSGGADVVWNGNFTMREVVTLGATDALDVLSGTASFLPSALTVGVSVTAGGDLSFNNVEVISAVAVSPSGNFTVKGSFSKAGVGVFDHTATGGTITFRNTVQKEIINASASAALIFDILAVYNGSTVLTSSNFQIGGTAAQTGKIDVQGTGQFKADLGTITFDDPAANITKSTNGILEFFNLTFTANATGANTQSDFTIKGDLTAAAAAALFTASAGSEITFDNDLVKTINTAAANRIIFFRIKVTDGSRVITAASAATGSFTISGVTADGESAGITIEGTGSFIQDASAATTFAGVSTFTKTIVKSTAGTLKFGNIVIADVLTNDVVTTSDFTIQGSAANLITMAGTTGGSLTASSPSTITLTHAGAIQNLIANVGDLVFNNLTVENVAVTLAATEAFTLNGNLTINGALGQLTAAADVAQINVSGTSQQKITGTSTNAAPVTLGTLIINKPMPSTPSETADDLLMELNVAFANAGFLTLTDGDLNLGSKTLTLDQVTVTRTNGNINGATGTLTLATTASVFTAPLANALFTPAYPTTATPTLWNLNVDIAQSIAAGVLTVNNDLTTTDVLTIPAASRLIVYGDITGTAGDIVGTNPITSVLELRGTGVVNSFADALFGAKPSLVIGRGETLTGSLTADATNVLTIDCGINYFDLSLYTLDLTGASVVVQSGSILSGDNSSVNYGTIATVPANLFKDNKVGTFTIGADVTLEGDLEVRTALVGAFDITTGDNVLTIGPDATAANMTNAEHVIGNLRRTVTEIATPFWVGGDGAATGYRPLTLQFASIGSSQIVTVSSTGVEPTSGRGGNPNNSVNTLWSISQEGTTPSDSLKMTFEWANATGEQVGTDATTTFPAKWLTNSWSSYYHSSNTVAVGGPSSVITNSYPVLASALSGNWTVFNTTLANGNTPGRAAAINTTINKIAISNIDPNPVKNLFPFKVTVQLQDQYGNPVVAIADMPITVTSHQGTALVGIPTGTILTGNSSTVINGFNYTAATGGSSNNVLQANLTTPDLINWMPTVSEPFSILGSTAITQASAITLTAGSDITKETVGWTRDAGATGTIIMIKAGSALDPATEYPTNATTYIANANLGSGSSIGEASVVYKGAGSSVSINGLAPGTEYYIYAFTYLGTDGNEVYRTSTAAGNPKVYTTTVSSNDDDINYGDNDTRSTSKKIGTNTPVKGTIQASSDEDWFNFAVTSANPNVRARLYDLPGNYTLELYDMTGRRIRRSTLNTTSNEAMIANDLPAGTYTVRVFSADGSAYVQSGDEYYLKVTTSGSEIFSVTP